MIPRFKPQYGISEWLAVFRTSRNNIQKYERMFAKKFGCKYGVMFSHGRTAIYALLKVWGLDKAEVICPAYTCVVVPNAIVLSGNTPVFVDCKEGSFNMSLDGIRKAITDKTRVIIPTHLFGYPMDVHAIDEIAEKAEKKYGHKIYVIQDCAHCYGAKWKGELVTNFGDATIFGSNISKVINSIFGGMVITKNSELANSIRVWRDQNMIEMGWRKTLRRFFYFVSVNIAFNRFIYTFVNWLERKGFLDHFVKYYDDEKIDLPYDWNHAPSKIEARVGLVQLGKYDHIIENRRRAAQRIIKEMQQHADIWMLPFDRGSTYSHIVGVVEDRELWVTRYQKMGIQLGIIIEYSIPMMKAYSKYRKEIPVTSNEYSKRMINFPAYK